MSALPGEGQRWPVLLWLHGGGNNIGAAELFDGGNLAQTHDVVVVIAQYRLGPLGWLRHASLRADAPSRGIEDLEHALGRPAERGA